MSRDITPLSDDEFATDDIVTLCAQDGEEVPFVEIAGIAHAGNFYAILKPLDPPEGMAENEALVFCVTTEEDGSTTYQVVLDDDIIDIVFAKYNRLLDEAISEDGEDA